MIKVFLITFTGYKKLCREVHFFEPSKIVTDFEKIKPKFCEMDFLGLFCTPETVDVVQLVRTSDCGSESRGFESHLPPNFCISSSPIEIE